MDETTNEVVEAVEPVAEAEDIEGLDAEAEAMWDNDDYDDFGEESDSTEVEADQPTTEEADTTSTTEQTEATTEATDADQYLELKHFDEVRKVGKEEAKQLAQMGMDYPRVKSKLAEANIALEKMKKYEGFLNDLKGDYNTIDDLIIDTRARIVSDKEKIPIEEARNRVARELNGQPQQNNEPKESAAVSAEKQSLTTFTELYPDIKAKDIPKEVWNDMKVTHSLVASWARYQNKTAAKENETLKQNEKNKTRATGSMKSSGTKVRDEYDAMWYEDEY